MHNYRPIRLYFLLYNITVIGCAAQQESSIGGGKDGGVGSADMVNENEASIVSPGYPGNYNLSITEEWIVQLEEKVRIETCSLIRTAVVLHTFIFNYILIIKEIRSILS